jgi:outer membrane protein TolC
VSRTILRLAVAAVAVGVAAPVSAQDTDRVKELVRQALAQQAQPSQPTSPTALNPTGPVVNLTEEEAVNRATERNLNIASERLTPQTFDFSLAAARAVFLPTVTSSVQHQDAETPTNSAFSGGARNLRVSQNWSGGLTQNLSRWGSNYNVQWTNQHSKTNSTNATCNPCYSSGLTATFTQPLLRDFKIDSERAALTTTRINQEISELNLSATIQSILAQTRQAYWELVYAYQAVEAAQRSLELATKLVQDNRARVEIGTMAPIDVVQAQAEEATRRQQLVNAQATLRNNELALKRLIVGGTDDELWRATIVPTDRPAVTTEAIDLEGAVRNALSRRTDLSVTKKNLESSDITLRALENATLPNLSLQGTLNLQGQAGVSVPLRDPITGDTIQPPAGTYWTTLARVSQFDAPTWSFRVQFDYPIGTTSQKANFARQQLLRRQTESSIKTTELQIATEVTSAALAVRNTLEAMQAAGVARELSERRLEAAESKFQVGMATNFEVVQAQRDLADARNRELREQLNYQRALIDFQRVQVSPR